MAVVEPSATPTVENLSKSEQFGMTLLVEGLHFWERTFDMGTSLLWMLIHFMND